MIFLVLFTPWALGTTQTWSVWTANVACYGIGGLLIAKWVLRRALGFQPPRWGEPVVLAEGSGVLQAPARRADWGARVLGVITVAFLGYVLISAINARAIYDERTHAFEYIEAISWLPTTYNRGATWFAFFQYLGLAAAFWGIRDWLLARSAADFKENDDPRWSDPQGQVAIPARLRRLLWILAINGAILAIVGIIQRADGTSKLLWIVGTRRDNPPEMLFGPWAYRANAAQYFNMLWPICLAFWLWAQERAGRALHRRMGRFDGPQLVILPCAVFAAVCPMISSSRGGALVSVVAGAAAAVVILVVSRREVSQIVRWLTAGGIIVAGLAAIIGGWSTVRERLAQPDKLMATDIEAGTADFTVLTRLRLPDRRDQRWYGLFSASGYGRNSYIPYSLHIGMAKNGHLVGQLIGSATTNAIWVTATNFFDRFSGNETLVALVRRADGMKFYADGEELGVVEGRAGNAPPWNGPLFSRYAFVSDPMVTEVAFVNFALTREEMEAAGPRPLAELESAVLGSIPSTEIHLPPDSVLVPEGARAEITSRAADPHNSWFAVRRAEGAGILGFARRLEDLDPRLRGPMDISATVWNPGNSTLYVGANLDGGFRGVVEIDPRTETTISIPSSAPHGGTPRLLEVVVTDAGGAPLRDAPSGSHLYVRDLRLNPRGAVFSRKLSHEIRLLELSDRMSGRPEIYESAVEMARDYPIWGSGAGSFASLYQLYLKPGQDWAAYLHNDWMEMRITVGIVGMAMIIAGLATLFIRSWFGPGLTTLRVVVALWWLALGGCLVHARFDFPFQIYSVLFLFVLLSSCLMVITGARRG